VIQCFSDLKGSTSNLILKLLLGACGCPIYPPREFQKVWRPHSSRPNCWSYLWFQEGRTCLALQRLDEEDMAFGLHISGVGSHWP
jgi:hypothetical protein